VIVVDTNIIASLYVTGERSNQAEEALIKDPVWVAPVLWRSEFRNVLATYLHQDVISLKDARQMMSEAETLLYGGEYEVVTAEVLRLTASSTCSAYDCEFVALAEDLGVPLVTIDKKILREFPDSSIRLDEFVSS